MSLIHLARQGFITKSALPNVTRQRGTTTGTANLMLYGAGKDFAIGTNTTFTDSSSNNFTVTRNGDTIQATNNPFTGSVYFDGTDDYLSVANNTALQPGTGTFTIECWIYRGVAGAAHTIYAKGGASTGFVFQVTSSNTLRFTDTTTNIDSTGTIPTLTWTHVAVARSGTGSNQTKLFINGIVDGQGTVATDFNQTEEVRIGTDRSGAADFNGYISCLRFVKGTAVYTANFTVPTSPLTAITNTQLLLLTAQQAPFRDSSTNNFTVTANGNAAGSGLEPFPVNYAGSAYFDGTGDYLSVADNAAFTLGTGDFTIECWVNLTSASTTRWVTGQTSSGFAISSSSFLIAQTTANKINGVICSGSTTYEVLSASAISLNTWVHIAFVRNGTSLLLFIDGVQSNSLTISAALSVNDSTNQVGIGRAGEFNSEYLQGYVSNLRFIKGTAQYTAAFTPPAAPLTAVTNTSLLLLTNNVGPFVDTSANGFPVLRNGDAVQTGFSPFTGQPSAGSGYFDGTGDTIEIANRTEFDLGSGNFTIETYINFSAAPSSAIEYHIWQPINHAFGFKRPQWYISSNVLSFAYFGTNIVTASLSWSTNVWYHLAVTRSGNTYTLWRDGVSVGTGTNTNTLDSASGYRIGNNINAYFSNFRLVKGTALYTSNFTPATAPLPAVPNTSLLLNTDNYTIANSTPTYLPVTVNGNTTISTAQYPTGMNRSIYFDGSGDTLVLPNNASLSLGSSDFTIESYVYLTKTGVATFCSINADTGAWAGVRLDLNQPSTNGVNLLMTTNAIIWNINFTVSNVFATNTWKHIAIVRSGTSVYLFIDGVQAGATQSISGSLYGGTINKIGAVDFSGDPAFFPFQGYMSNFRIVKGSALYTSNFTPPAAPLPLSVTVPAYVTNNIYGVYQLA